MDNTNKKEIELLNGQLIASFIFIICLVISLLITYNEKLEKENKKVLFTNRESIDIALINRFIIFLLGIYFVYNAIISKKLNNSKNNINKTTSNLQILASILALLTTIIILYIIIINYNNQDFDISNENNNNNI